MPAECAQMQSLCWRYFKYLLNREVFKFSQHCRTHINFPFMFSSAPYKSASFHTKIIIGRSHDSPRDSPSSIEQHCSQSSSIPDTPPTQSSPTNKKKHTPHQASAKPKSQHRKPLAQPARTVTALKKYRQRRW